MKIKLNIKYLFAFCIFLTAEVMIAIFAWGNFIRDYLGDVLVVVLVFCFIKTFVTLQRKILMLTFDTKCAIFDKEKCSKPKVEVARWLFSMTGRL